MKNYELVKELRERTGLSQLWFSKLYHIPVGTYRNWEQGRTLLPDYVFLLLKRAVEADEEYVCSNLLTPLPGAVEEPTMKDGFRTLFYRRWIDL